MNKLISVQTHLHLHGDPQREFKTIVGKHGMYMVELIQGDAAQDAKRLMQTWVKLSDTNRDWANLLIACNPQLAECAHALVNTYSNALADFIVRERHTSRATYEQRVKDVCALEADFYAKLGDNSAIREAWASYTHGLIGMTKATEEGKLGDAEVWGTGAAHAIQNGMYLGTLLDKVLYKL